MENIAKEYRKNSGERIRDFFSKVGTAHVVTVGILLFVLIAFSRNPETDKRYLYVIIFILVGVISVLAFKPEKQKNFLPDYVAKEIAQEALDKKVREGKEFAFDSKVFVMQVCHLKYENDFVTGQSGPVSWDIGFVELVHGTQYKKEGVIRIHPYNGFVTGIAFYPLGYTGRESRDKDIIPVGIVQGSVKTTDFGKPSGVS